jgi:hypothetical protein
MVDPWCNEIYEPRDNGKLYVAVKYKQVATRPVRVQPIGCGCDDTACENSRWRDGYEIRILNAWPNCGATPPNLEDLFKGPTPQCAPCPDEPWVVLAEVTVEKDGKITTIDTCACRRLAASLMNVWWACTEGTGTHETGVHGCVKIYDYGDITEDAESELLHKFAAELAHQPGMKGHIIFYGPAQSTNWKERLKLAVEHLAKGGIDPRSVNMRKRASTVIQTELYICEPDASPPIIRDTSPLDRKETTEPQAEIVYSKEGGEATPLTPPPTATATNKSLSSSRKQTRRKGGAPEPT